MNVIEAVSKAVAGSAIMNTERNEWIIYSSGALRWKSNRQTANLTPRDIMTEKWICEDDLITVSKIQIEEALTHLKIAESSDGDLFIVDDTKFFESIMSASHTNKLRISSGEQE